MCRKYHYLLITVLSTIYLGSVSAAGLTNITNFDITDRDPVSEADTAGLSLTNAIILFDSSNLLIFCHEFI